jgi:hypothetical protein
LLGIVISHFNLVNVLFETLSTSMAGDIVTLNACQVISASLVLADAGRIYLTKMILPSGDVALHITLNTIFDESKSGNFAVMDASAAVLTLAASVAPIG